MERIFGKRAMREIAKIVDERKPTENSEKDSNILTSIRQVYNHNDIVYRGLA